MGTEVAAPPGHRVRPATWDDLAEVAVLFQRAEADRRGTISFREQDLRLRWLGRDDFDDPVVVVDDRGDIVAFAELTVDDDIFATRVAVWIDARVDPDHLDRGLATWLHAVGENRARREAIARGLEAVMLRTTVTAGDAPAEQFLAGRGFRPVHHYLTMHLHLDGTPPPPDLPAHVVIRDATPADLPAIHRAHQAAFADHPSTIPLDLDGWIESRTSGTDPDWSLWQVAEVAGEIVGICLARAGTPEGADGGYIRDLGVVPDHRRRGIALALLRSMFRRFATRGLAAASLEVDDDTLEGAVALYRRAGMAVTRRTDVLEHAVPAAAPAPPSPRH